MLINQIRLKTNLQEKEAPKRFIQARDIFSVITYTMGHNLIIQKKIMFNSRMYEIDNRN